MTRVEPRPIGLVAFLATIVMLFTAFTASYLIRRTSPDWRPIPMPDLLWSNTGVLALSSAALEVARRRRNRKWLAATLILGLIFLAGQAIAATQVSLRSNPHASFFFMLSGLHGVHLLGGIGALAVAFTRPALLGPCSVYWHFVGIVWGYLLVLLWIV